MKKIIVMMMLMFLVSLGSLWALTEPSGDVEISVTLANPVLQDSGVQTTYLRIGLLGERPQVRGVRPKINTAIVLDRSGSMSGDKIAQAISAAHTALDMLQDGDVVSIITYSDGAQVLVPATILDRRNRQRFHDALAGVYASGNTALFSGVVSAGREIDLYLQEQRVSRVILLSDGIANVGPSSPRELGNLGETLRRRGISVSTIGLGLGYNADLMYELAARSDGNHAFVENPEELTAIFSREFESALSVVAKELEIGIRFAPGIRPVRILNRQGELYGNRAVITMNQIYGGREQYILVEVEVDAAAVRGNSVRSESLPGESLPAADISLSWYDLGTESRRSGEASTVVAFTSAPELVREKQDKRTLADAALQIATLNNEQALQLRDEGRVEEAQAVLKENARFLAAAAEEYGEAELEAYAQENVESADLIEDDAAWEGEKKSMRASQHGNKIQQIY